MIKIKTVSGWITATEQEARKWVEHVHRCFAKLNKQHKAAEYADARLEGRNFDALFNQFS